MNVHFVTPAAAKQVGGIANAVEGLREALQRQGTVVMQGGDVSDPFAVHHFHGLWDRSHSKLAARLRKLGRPYVVSPHGMLEPWAFRHKWWKKWPYFHLFEKPHLAGAQRLLATSEEEANNLRTFFPALQCEVLPLGLATASKGPDYLTARSAFGWKDSELILLFLSRIHPKKGLHLLLAALAKLPRELNQQMRLVIVGGGQPSYLSKLKRFHEKNRSRLPPIDWIGEVWSDKKWAYLQGADLFCLPSYSENFGLAILEALQVGTRVLTTNQTPWGAIPSWNAGYIVDPAEEAISSALIEQLTKRPPWSLAQRDLLAKNIHNMFSWEAVGPAYLRLYAELGQPRDR